MMAEERSKLDLVDAAGAFLSREVFVSVFYIPHRHVDIASVAEVALRAYVDLVSYRNLTEYADPNGEWQPLTAQTFERIREQWFPGSCPNADVILSGSGAGVPEFWFRYFGNALAGVDGKASYLWCWVPRIFWETHRDRTKAFLDLMAEVLPFSSGYANLGLSGGQKRRRQGLASRYLGLDIARPVAVCLDIDAMAAGSYWLNYFGPSLCAKVGGIDALRNALPQEASIEKVSTDGCRVQLGPEPLLGDVNRRERLPMNESLAKFLYQNKVLHLPMKCIYFEDTNGLSDPEAQKAWHLRFISGT
jgi:hypothetical protein